MDYGMGFSVWIQQWSGLNFIQMVVLFAALCMVGFTLTHFGFFAKLNQKLARPASPLLVGCDVCLGKVSQNAHVCPHCGEPFANVNENAKPRRGF